MKRYATILADPPWAANQTGGRGASQHYPVMSFNEIKSIPVEQLATENAHLWLWVTNSDVFRQMEVMHAWGFTYKACLTWIKPYFRLGNYLRNQTEHVLLGVKGSLPIQFKSQGTWFYAPLQDHSHKPEEQYAIIERCSPGPRLELFGRRQQPGWDVMGNAIDGLDIRTAIRRHVAKPNG